MKFLAFVLILFCTCIEAVDYRDCGSKAIVHELRVQGCKKTPCILKKGRTYKVELDVQATSPSQSLPYKVTTKIFYETVTLLKGNACNELTLGSCPVTPGGEFSYATSFHIEEYFPSFKEDVTIAVWDDTLKSTLVCAVVSVKIQSSSKNFASLQRYYPGLRFGQRVTRQHPLLELFGNRLDNAVKSHVALKE